METREVTEYKVWVLELASMFGGVDKARPVAVFDSYETLVKFYNDQLAPEPYKDGDWYKVFKEGSLLEWYNGCDSLEEKSFQERQFGGVGTAWVQDIEKLPVPFNPS